MKPAKLLVLLVSASLSLQACSKKTGPSLAEITAQVQNSPAAKTLFAQDGNSLEYFHGVQDDSLHTEKFKHRFNGVEVLGSGVDFHSNDSFQGITPHLSSVTLDTSPSFDASTAKQIAQSLEPKSALQGEPTLKILPQKNTQTARLIYIVPMQDREVLLDAHTKQHIATIADHDNLSASNVKSAASQGIFVTPKFNDSDLQGCELKSLAGIVEDLSVNTCKERISESCQILNSNKEAQSINAQNCVDADESIDASAARAQKNASIYLNYLQLSFHRDGLDGQGTNILSVVHAGQESNNAKWIRKNKLLAYGDGDGVHFSDMTFGVDIAAHELTHGLVQETAGLLGIGESGALNESLADFFGKLAEGNEDWKFGKSVVLDKSNGDAIRDLQNPGSVKEVYFDSLLNAVVAPAPSKRSSAAPMVEPCTPDNDSCSVHFNATIPGHTWYLLYVSLGKSKAEQLVYLALTHYFTEVTDFTDAAKDIIDACKATLTSDDCDQVKAVLSATEMVKAE